jgi:hypothetical protein
MPVDERHAFHPDNKKWNLVVDWREHKKKESIRRREKKTRATKKKNRKGETERNGGALKTWKTSVVVNMMNR